MRVYVSGQPEIVAFVKAAGEEIYHLGADQHALPADHEIVAVDVGETAKEVALRLVSRGVRAVRLSYVDLPPDWQQSGASFAHPKHLHWDDVVPLAEMEMEEDFPVYTTGLPYLDRYGHQPSETKPWWRWRLQELVIMAGPYGCGKSTFGQMLAAGFVAGNWETLRSPAMLCSWEDIGSEVYRNIKRFGDRRFPDLLKHVHFVRRRVSQDRLVSWYMELVRYHHDRYGTKFFLLDPWNHMDHRRDPKQTETDYVLAMMNEFRSLTEELGIIIIISTHVPSRVIRGNGGVEPFKIAHAHGSSQFGNRADRGICVVRTKGIDPNNADAGQLARTRGHAIVRLDKGKVERLMGERHTIALSFDPENFQYTPDFRATRDIDDIWKD